MVIISPSFLLDSLLDRQCGNPRDSVFAFYNLFPKDLQEYIAIDYGLRLGQVLLQAICGIIKTTRNLYAITLRGHQKTPVEENLPWQLSMPSWCLYVGTSFESNSMASLDKFDAGTDPADISFCHSNRVIRVRGFAIGRIFQIMHGKMRHVNDISKGWNDKDLYHIKAYYRDCLCFGLSFPSDQEAFFSEDPNVTLTQTSTPIGHDLEGESALLSESNPELDKIENARRV